MDAQERRFRGGLALIAAAAAVERVLVVLVFRRTVDAKTAARLYDAILHRQTAFAPPNRFWLWGDSWTYHWSGRALAAGAGYVDPAYWKGLFGASRLVPSAYHPPGYPTFLGAVSFAGMRSITAHRLASCLLGVALVVVVGYATRLLAGRRAGLLAALLAAGYPGFLANEEGLLSESLYALTIAVVLLCAVRFWQRPNLLRSIGLGVAIGVAALTRSEALALSALVALPLAWRDTSRPWRARLGVFAAGAGATVLVIAPWAGYNLSRFHDPVLITSGYGSTILQGNCPSVYEGRFLGYHDVQCFDGVSRPGDESQTESHFRRLGLDYVKAHKGRAVVVAFARAGRVLDVYRPWQNADFNRFLENRTRYESDFGLLWYWLLAGLAPIGLLSLRRLRAPILPFAMLALVSVGTAAASYGITRYRVPLEVAIVALGGVALARVWGWVRDPAQRTTSFTRHLTVITAGALVLRFAFAVSRRYSELRGDDFWYHWQARALLHGHWWVDPFSWHNEGKLVASAGHPPLYPAYLALASLFGGTSQMVHRFASCLLGAAAVVLVALLARRLAGERAGLLAAGVAAVCPALWIVDGMLLSESLYVLAIAAVLLAAYEFFATPRVRSSVALGVLVALAALVRVEAALLVPMILGGWLLSARARTGVGGRERLRIAGAGALASLLVVAPWLVRNELEFRRSVGISTGLGSVTAVANCDSTYHGSLMGLYDIRCLYHALGISDADFAAAAAKGPEELGRLYRSLPGDESQRDAHLRQIGIDFARAHERRVPLVVATRVARALGVYAPRQQMRFEAFVERRGTWPTRGAFLGWYAMVALGAAGIVVLRRRRVTLVPLVSVVVMVVLTVSSSMGLTRYRIPLDVALAVVAGIGLDALLGRSLRRGAQPGGEAAAEVPVVSSVP